jgi:PA domain
MSRAALALRSFAPVLAFCLSLAGATSVFAGTQITIVNGNAAGVGFNDPAPAAPVGGNAGTTLGQQRLIAFQAAANIWGNTLDSNSEVRIVATFEPLSCTATAATLGSAGTISIFSDFPGAEFPNTWYHGALADKRAGFDLDPTSPDIRARFNVNLGNPGCLTGIGWYLGLDTNPGTQIDLVTVLLHEFAHGLGFSQFASVSTGTQILDQTDVYGRLLLDNSTGKTWDAMTNAERKASAINSRNVVWNGAAVTAAVPDVLSLGTPLLRVNAPAAIAGVYAVGAAAFGPPLSAPGVTGNVVLALDPADAAGPSISDGCSAITNAGSLAGNIALLDRGTCGFVVKVKNAQNAGAIAVLVADNVAGGPPAGLGGVDPTITIPSVRITLADGTKIRAQLAGGVSASLGVDPTVFAGADPSGRAIMNAPNPVQSGSSISHWDPIAFRNQLMEPAINGDLTHSVKQPEDLTLAEMRDVGWYADADLDLVADENDCEPHSDLRPTVVVGSCNSGVANPLFTNGCTISDLIGHVAAGAQNHGGFVSGVAGLTNDLKKQGFITGAQKGAIQSCAAGASIP